MNLKSVMSRFLKFFTLFLALVFGVSESFALTLLEPGAEFQPTVYSETITLTAVYKSKTYDVRLDRNDGTSDSDTVVATYGEKMPDITVPTRAGYMFEGYFTAETGGVLYYDTQGKSVKKWDIDSDGPIVLYAHWTKNGVCSAGTYYDSDNKEVKTCPAGSYCEGGEYNESTNTNDCKKVSCPTEYPNSVAGATNKGDCYVSVEAGMYWNGTSAVDCDAGKYKKAHQLYHGQTSSCESCARGYTSDKKASECYLITSPGMYVATAGEDQQKCEAGYYCPGDRKVMFNTIGGREECPSGFEYSVAGTTTQDMCYTECNISSIKHASAVEGQDFYGQSVKDSCVATSCDTGYGVQNGLCEPNVYTITLRGNGASKDMVVYQKYADGWYSDAAATDKITKLPVPTRKYYTFVGYFLGADRGLQITDASGAFSSGTDGNLYDYRNAVLTRNTTLFAHWSPNTYMVEYNANDASGTMSKVQHVCDEAKNLTTNEFTSASNDKQFLGWSTKSDATVAEYTNGQSVVNLAEDNGATVILYPVWEPCTKCAPGAGASCALTAPKGVCTYSTTCKANYENLQNSGKYNPSCSAVKYGLSYVLNGGEFISGYEAVAECSVASGEIPLPKAEKLVKKDYRFVGWYDNEAFSGNPVESLPAGICVANKKFYAKWTRATEDCISGLYYNGTTFEDCPNGYYCPGVGTVSKGTPGCRVECPAEYRDGGIGSASQSQCQMSVPQGSYLATAKGTQPTVCPAGKYTAAAVMVGYGETSECASCEANSYCTSGTKYSCPTEYPNSVAGATNKGDCYVSVEAGMYWNGTSAVDCDAGKYNEAHKVYHGQTSSCVTCPDGYTSKAGSGSVNKCYLITSPGMYVAKAGEGQQECEAGYYCPGDQTVMFNTIGGREECPDGYGDGGTGSASQSQCQMSVPQGSYLATAKGTQPTVCPAGKYTAAAVMVGYGETSECASCEANSYCTSGTKYSCPTEYPNSVAGAKGEGDCYVSVAAGMYWNGTSAVDCDAGEYNEEHQVYHDQTSSCVTCPDGYTSKAGSGSVNECYLTTDAGMYVATAGADQQKCEAGYYCPGDRKVMFNTIGGREECPDGYGDGGTGYASQSQCQMSVPQGSYLATAKGTQPTVCPAGKYTAAAVKVEYGKTSECASCEANSYCTSGDKYSCSDETGGVFVNSVAGSDSINSCYKPCADASGVANMTGYDYYGSDDKDTCQAASCQSGYTVVDGVCELCPADHVCDPANNNGAPYKCSALTEGVYTKSKAGSGSVNECYLTTSAGMYVATAGEGQKQCEAGDFCVGGDEVMVSGVGGNKSCSTELGSGYSSDAGAKAAEDCYTKCKMYPNATQMSGHDYYGAGQDTCKAIECEEGYTLENGFCGSCPADRVCDPMYDSGRPYSCAELTDDKYTKAAMNSASIDACYLVTSPGKYVAEATQGEVLCKAGDYCPGRTKVMYRATGGNSACSAFGAGYSSDAGAEAATQCYQDCASVTNALEMSGRDYYGSDDQDNCAVSTCVAGFTVDDGKCSQCRVNYVCDPNYDSGRPHSCFELTDGVYTKSKAGSGSIDACYLLTDAGMYVATAGDGQQKCEDGYYCPGDQTVMFNTIGGREECPSGFERSDVGASSARQCYASCANTDKATDMSGQDFYDSSDKDTCAAVMCEPGYTVSNGRCVLCPADHVCHPEMKSGTPVACADLTGETHGFALAGSDSVLDCYTACEPYDVEYGTAVQLSDTEFYPAQCQYKGVSVTGNPCKIVDGLCVETSCNHNYEMINGKCAACARENAISYKQNGGNCVVESCISGFHPNGQSCEINVAECFAPNALSAKREWNATKQSFGECIVTECAEGYHLGGNVCQSDEQVCELEHGVGVREWNHKAKKWGDCVATKCDPGYTSDPGQTNELWKQCGRCNNMYSAGGELAASSYVDGCEIASCMYDGELYTLENNECVLICDTYSDETGSRKWNASSKKCERTCRSGYMSW